MRRSKIRYRSPHTRIKPALFLLLLVISACTDSVPDTHSATDQIPLKSSRPIISPSITTAPSPTRIGDPDVPINFERITSEQELMQSTVYCIIQDTFGFMWFGTSNGLSKYDGYHFTLYRHDPEDDKSLSSNIVWEVFQDREGELWIGTSNGLNRFNRDQGTFSRYQNDPADPLSLSNNSVRAIYEDYEGDLWIGTDHGLNRLNRQVDQFSRFLYAPLDREAPERFDREMEHFLRYLYDPSDTIPLQHDIIETIFEDRFGVLWLGTRGGLKRFDRARVRFIHYPHIPNDPTSLSHSYVRALYEDRMGNFWVGTVGGGLNLFNRDSGEFQHYRQDPNFPQTLSDNRVWIIFEDSDGTLWIGTERGLDRYDRKYERFDHFQSTPSDPQSLSSNIIYSIFEDRSGVLWIGTRAGGINKVDRYTKRFVHYQHDPTNPNSLPDNMVWSIHQDRSGVLWIGTEEGLTAINRENGLVINYNHNALDPESLISNHVGFILEDQSGQLWIGTGNGLDRFDRTNEIFYHYVHDPNNPKSLSNNAVTAIYEDRSGALWFGTYGGGFNRLTQDSNEFIRYSFTPDDPTSMSNTIWAFLEDRSGDFWIGTLGGGLYQFDRDNEQYSRHHHDPLDPSSLSDDRITTLLEDQAETLWVGTLGGMNRYDPVSRSFTQYRESEGLPNDIIHGILEDSHGNLWVSTNQGLSRFDPQTETFRNYGVIDGLQNSQFNSNAFFKNTHGEMFFGGVNGFNSFYPEEILDDPYKPPIVLTAFTQGGEEVMLDKELESADEVTLHWPNNFFEFEFSALSYAKPEKNQFAYMLEGFDKEWVFSRTRRYGRYMNLPGGAYTLRIIGSNHDGVWNDEGTSLKITIVPPFWATLWFRGLAVLIVIGGVLGAYQWRVKSLQARSRVLEGQVETRTFEIERRRQELEALYLADERMHRYLDLDQVLQALVEVAVDILQADKSSVFVCDEENRRLEMRVAKGFRPEAMPALSLAMDEGVVGLVASLGEAVIVEDALTDARHAGAPSRMAATLLAEGVRSFMHLPIMIDEAVFGVFNVNFTKPHAFREEEQRLFAALAQRAALAIENAQLYEQTQEMAVMEERGRLARDLHDAVTQTLFSASLIAEALPDQWESDKNEGQHLLTELRQLSRGALAEMRSLLLELRPASLTETDLGELMRQLAAAVTGRKGVPVAVNVDGHCELPADVHVALYRIAQEALNNVVKHADADHVSIHLNFFPRPTDGAVSTSLNSKNVVLRIDDDGCGFDPNYIPPDCLGIGIIRERAETVGADLLIDSQPHRGTSVVVTWKGYQDDEQ
jgi:ligand-binding sensor domain-containing protein/nitrate/nitrite-specific signal transduction histidine kinase